MDEPIQTLPTISELATSQFTTKHWLNYYRNIWLKTCVAGTIDIQNDAVKKATTPGIMVPYWKDRQKIEVTIEQRLEMRKIDLQVALDCLNSIETVIAEGLDDAAFIAKYWSTEALTIDADMLKGKKNGAAGLKFKVLKDFGEVKEGDIVDGENDLASWSDEEIEEKVADGTLSPITDAETTVAKVDSAADADKTADTTSEQKAAEVPATKKYIVNVDAGITIDGFFAAKGAEISLTDEAFASFGGAAALTLVDEADTI